MLVAVTAGGGRLVASETARALTVVCPECTGELRVRLPRHRVAHFAHLPGAVCRGTLTLAQRRAVAEESRAQARLARLQADIDATGQQKLFEDVEDLTAPDQAG